MVTGPSLDPVDVGWSLATTRSVFEHRAVIIGSDQEELTAGLTALAAGQPASGVVTGAVSAARAVRVGFVFAGRGSQRAGMGAELHAASPVFAAVFDRACVLLEAGLGVPVAGVVLGGGAADERADQTVFAQAGLFAVGAGLVALLAACGVSADAVAGHSVEAVAGAFADRGVRVRRLRVSHAFHSARMDPVLAELGEVAAGLEYAAPRVPWAGGLSGELMPECEPGYWVRQAREPVRFADAVATLAAQGVSVFLEIGPDGTLSALGPAALGDGDGVFVPVLRPGQPAPAAVIGAPAEAHVRGVPLDWDVVLPAGRKVGLPTYAFQHQRFWPEPAGASAGDMAAAGLAAVGHPLLGAAVELAGGEGYVLTGRLSVRSHPWLADHAMAGTVLVPGTAFVEMAVAAGIRPGAGGFRSWRLRRRLCCPWTERPRSRCRWWSATRMPRLAGRCRCTPAVSRRRLAGRGRGMPAGGWCRPDRLIPGWRGCSRCGRRPGRCRWRPRGCIRAWPRPGTVTGRPSGDCGRRGGVRARCSRRSRYRRRRRRARDRSGCIRRCLTRRCTQPGSSERRSVPGQPPGLVRSCCRSRGPECRCMPRARRCCGSGWPGPPTVPGRWWCRRIRWCRGRFRPGSSRQQAADRWSRCSPWSGTR